MFYSDRLSRLVIEHALQFLPSEDIPVETPTGAIYKGKRIYNKICALPIMRAGDSMVPALCSVVRNVKVGKILIQSDKNKTPKVCNVVELLFSSTLTTCDYAAVLFRVT